MTTPKNPVSRKIGIIALSCALLAMTLLSGCTVPDPDQIEARTRRIVEAARRSCVQSGGSFNLYVEGSFLGDHTRFECVGQTK